MYSAHMQSNNFPAIFKYSLFNKQMLIQSTWAKILTQQLETTDTVISEF